MSVPPTKKLPGQPPGDLRFRQLTAEDQDLLQFERLGRELFVATFGHLYRSEDLETFLRQVYSPGAIAADLENDRKIWIAHLGPRWIGFCKMGPLGLPVQPLPVHALELKQLYVHSDYHGQGVADGLMQKFFHWAELQRCDHLYISCWSENHRALAFYRRYGFVPVGAYKFWVGSHADDEWILKRTDQSA